MKKIVKLITLAIIALLIVLTCTGCTSTTNLTSTENSTTEKTQYNVGETYEDENIKIMYVSVNENFTDYSEYATVENGYKVIEASFEFENVGSSDQYVSSYDFNCYADGYDCDIFWFVDNSSFSSTLSSGKKATGNVYFEVPENATEISLEYETDWLTSSKIEFIVK